MFFAVVANVGERCSPHHEEILLPSILLLLLLVAPVIRNELRFLAGKLGSEVVLWMLLLRDVLVIELLQQGSPGSVVVGEV